MSLPALRMFQHGRRSCHHFASSVPGLPLWVKLHTHEYVYYLIYNSNMKQRITYFLRDERGIDPATLDVSKDSLQIPGLNAAKEWRITAGVPELPQEVNEYAVMAIRTTTLTCKDMARFETEP